MTKIQAIVKVIKENGGAAPLTYIYNHITKFYPDAMDAKDWKAGIRGVLYRELYRGFNFKRVDIGVYALTEYDDLETFEGEKITVRNKAALIKKAQAFITTAPSHKKHIVKIRIENRNQKKIVSKLEDYSCQVCGWSIEWKDGNGKNRYSIDIDHIIPKANGGGEEISNLWALCPNCHKKKTVGVLKINLNLKKVYLNNTAITLHHDFHLFI
ncbi:MAG: HNH endonuclease [Patescibacteria group bacterium]